MGKPAPTIKIDGRLATQFGVSCVSQLMQSSENVARLRQTLEALAACEPAADARSQAELEQARARLALITQELEAVGDNLARARNQAQFEVISRQFDSLRREQQELNQRIARMEMELKAPTSPDDVAAVLGIVERLRDLTLADSGMASAVEIFKTVNLRMFLRFGAVRKGTRTINRFQRGVVTFSDAAAPVPLYSGPTSRKHVRLAERRAATTEGAYPPVRLSESDGETESARNVSRNDCRSYEPWTPARDAFAAAFYGDREPHINELWAMSEAVA